MSPLPLGSGALDPRGVGADAIADLWWVMLWLSLIPVAIVLAMLAVIVVRRRREGTIGDAPAPEPVESPRRDRRIILLGGVALPIAVLIPVIAITIATTQAREPSDTDVLEIEVTGHQWWWDVTYPAPGTSSLDEGDTFRTANEINIPVDRPVELVGNSEDVIHSVWVPELDGKIDLIPGRTNRLRIEATDPGVYRGRCAEYCGLSHGYMHFLVVAREPEEFEEWRRLEAAPATTDVDQDVLQEFADSCAVCHDIRGVFEETSFRGDFGPDLTHFNSRRTLGAGRLSNTREALGRWIADPQGVKPGNRMPDVGLEGDELNDVLEFLDSLEPQR